MRNISFETRAFEDLRFWLENDRKILSRIMDLLDETQRNPFEGKGKPEPLKHEFSGYWSRRITGEHRLIYKVADDHILVHSCRFHYKK